MAYGIGTVSVEIEAADVLNNINIDEIVSYYGAGDLLDSIGESEAIEHFGIDLAE